jgi:hypothetical protein
MIHHFSLLAYPTGVFSTFPSISFTSLPFLLYILGIYERKTNYVNNSYE